MSWLLRANLRMSLRTPWQLLLALVGVALGIAVVVAIDLTIDAAQRAFEHSSEVVLGRATHFVSRPGGHLRDDEYARLRMGLPHADMAPVLEGELWLPEPDTEDTRSPRPLSLLGLDPLSEGAFRDFIDSVGAPTASPGETDRSGLLTRMLAEPGSVLATSQTARDLGWRMGEHYTVRGGAGAQRLTLVGELRGLAPNRVEALRNVLIADLSVAQMLLGRQGSLSRVDLIEPEASRVTAWRERVQALLPADARLQDAGSRARTARELTRAFRLNLLMLSLLALVVGLFLVFNAMSYSVVRRRAQFGLLRALGATRLQTLAVVVLEAAAIGVVAGLLGSLGGWGLAQRLIGLVTQVINDHYFTVAVAEAGLRWPTVLKAMLLAVPGSALAALAPALEAARVSPRVAFARSTLERRVLGLATRLAVVGVLLLAIGLVLLSLQGLLAGFACLLLMVLAFALATPFIVIRLCAGLQWLSVRTHLLSDWRGALLFGGVRRGLSRTAVAVAALAVALSATVGVQLMVSSFRLSLDDWLGATLSGDVYIVAPGHDTRLPAALPELVAAMPGVQQTAGSLDVTVQTGFGLVPMKVVGGDFAYRGLQLLQGRAERAYRVLEDGGGILVSEPFAHRHQLQIGESLVLQTPVGAQTLPIVAVFRDYTSEQGMLMLDRASYQRWYTAGGSAGVGSLALKLAPGVDQDAFVTRLHQRLAQTSGDAQVEATTGPQGTQGTQGTVGDPVGERAYRVIRNARIRKASLEIFDRTFAITRVLSLLATLTAAIGIVSALMALALERAAELATLRALGMTRAQVGALVLGQSGLLGLMAGLWSLPLGLALAGVLVHVINRRAFGWSMSLQVDVGVLLGALALALFASALATLHPAWRMARTEPAVALRAA
ncbi:MAG: ABC transporter permease [Gammaproteobacteria bacterium]|nr:ABC transporter permease [Gammaproteobacteria bacterium]